MTQSIDRRLLLTGAALPLATPATAQTSVKTWRMVTSWPRNLPGPGTSATRLAQRIKLMSGGRLDVQVFAAGEIVPAFGVLDAVGNGTVEMGHTASLFWQGKEPAAAFFTGIPFGLTPPEHLAFIREGGGQALWDRLYERFSVKPFLGGNTGLSMGGWFRREIGSLADVKGLKIRMVGLGAEVFSRMGATAIAIPPGDIYSALERGTVDGAEFTSPGSDIQLGLWKAAPFYYAPGFNKPNGSSECLINKALYDGLDSEMMAILAECCAAEAAIAVAEMDRLNMEALAVMVGQHGVKLKSFTPDVLLAARGHASDLVRDLSARHESVKTVAEAYSAFQKRLSPWSRLSLHAYLAARDL